MGYTAFSKEEAAGNITAACDRAEEALTRFLRGRGRRVDGGSLCMFGDAVLRIPSVKKWSAEEAENVAEWCECVYRRICTQHYYGENLLGTAEAVAGLVSSGEGVYLIADRKLNNTVLDCGTSHPVQLSAERLADTFKKLEKMGYVGANMNRLARSIADGGSASEHTETIEEYNQFRDLVCEAEEEFKRVHNNGEDLLSEIGEIRAVIADIHQAP